MKINRLETHDRLKHFTKQNFSISECCQDLINQRPFGEHPFYIFSHARTDDDGFTKRIIWQPRLTKPKAQVNSMLFKAYPGTDLIKVIWMIPAVELWESFKEGKMTENKTVLESIDRFMNDKERLEHPEEDDLSDMQIEQIYKSLSRMSKIKKIIHGV